MDAGLFAAKDQPVLIYSRAEGDVPPVAAAVEKVPMDSLPEVLADLRARGVE